MILAITNQLGLKKKPSLLKDLLNFLFDVSLNLLFLSNPTSVRSLRMEFMQNRKITVQDHR